MASGGPTLSSSSRCRSVNFQTTMVVGFFSGPGQRPAMRGDQAVVPRGDALVSSCANVFRHGGHRWAVFSPYVLAGPAA